MTMTKKICLNAIGISLFVSLALCLQVPVFENYYLCLGYVAMTVFTYYFGPASGMVIGAGGVIAYCIVINGLRGMPGWAMGNLVIGLAFGIACIETKKMRSQMLRILILTVVIVISTAIGILGVKSLTECVLYGQPFFFRVLKNIYAFVADIVVLIVSLPICFKMQPVMSKLVP